MMGGGGGEKSSESSRDSGGGGLESLAKPVGTCGVGMCKRAGDRGSVAHRFLIGLLVEGLTENSHDEEVDDEGYG